MFSKLLRRDWKDRGAEHRARRGQRPALQGQTEYQRNDQDERGHPDEHDALPCLCGQ